jgi:formylglycine-generating enzyme required for sulfatase activity
MKKANAWGLHDMSGNVWEWCRDRYDEKLSGGVDPAGASSGTNRVFRGGGWSYNAYGSRVAGRNGNYPSSTYSSDIGFRVLRSSAP